MTPDLAFALGRIAERIFIVIFGGLSLWMGWRLFAQAAVSDHQNAEFSFKGFALKLNRVGPGTFFALFGAAVLVSSIMQPLQLRSIPSNNESAPEESTLLTQYLQGNKSEIRRLIYGLNTAISISSIPPQVQIPEPDRMLLNDSTAITTEVRNLLVVRHSGLSAFETWKEWRERFLVNPRLVPNKVRPTVRSIEDLTRSTLDED